MSPDSLQKEACLSLEVCSPIISLFLYGKMVASSGGERPLIRRFSRASHFLQAGQKVSSPSKVGNFSCPMAIRELIG